MDGNWMAAKHVPWTAYCQQKWGRRWRSLEPVGDTVGKRQKRQILGIISIWTNFCHRQSIWGVIVLVSLQPHSAVLIYKMFIAWWTLLGEGLQAAQTLLGVPQFGSSPIFTIKKVETKLTSMIGFSELSLSCGCMLLFCLGRFLGTSESTMCFKISDFYLLMPS